MGDIRGVRDFYNATAQAWADDWYGNDLMLPMLKRFAALLGPAPRLLDVGCGAGYESRRLASLGAEVVGIDISEKSIRIAKEMNPGCHFEVMDCRQANDTLGAFDGIVAIALVVHIMDGDLGTLFKNFRKLLKPGGFLFIVFVEGDGFSEERSQKEVAGEKYNREFYLHRPERLIEAAQKHGLSRYDEWFMDEPIGQWRYLVFVQEGDFAYVEQ